MPQHIRSQQPPPLSTVTAAIWPTNVEESFCMFPLINRPPPQPSHRSVMSRDSDHTMAERIDRQRIQRDSQPPLCEASVNAGLRHKLEKEFSILPDNNFSGIANHFTQHERLSTARLEALNTLLSHITPCRVVLVLIVMRLLGMMSASHMVAPLALLHMRIQGWFGYLCLNPIQHKRHIYFTN